MENKKEVLIIIPAYNEEKNIVPLLEKLEQPEIAQIADVLIMNDASSDATNYVVKKRNHRTIPAGAPGIRPVLPMSASARRKRFLPVPRCG